MRDGQGKILMASKAWVVLSSAMNERTVNAHAQVLLFGTCLLHQVVTVQ